MFSRKAHVEALLKRSADDLKKIESKYNNSLHAQVIADDLRIDIKDFLEKLRSVLDYLAHDIRETHCPDASPKILFYFPVLADRPKFDGKVGEWYPGLELKSPDLYAYLESLQPYHNDYLWLRSFNRINNENKHKNLVPQTRKEIKQIRVTSAHGSVAWRPENVKFGPGVAVFGVPIDPKTQMPERHPSQTVEQIIWVDFHFEGENISALGLMNKAYQGISRIVDDVGKWL